MRWLLEWLMPRLGVLPGGDGGRPGLRAGAARLRRRAEYHREGVERARRAFDDASRRVRVLEISEDAEVSELVEAHQGLRGARQALEHHERRLGRAEELYEMMRADLRRLESGREPTHREAYAAELDG